MKTSSEFFSSFIFLGFTVHFIGCNVWGLGLISMQCMGFCGLIFVQCIGFGF